MNTHIPELRIKHLLPDDIWRRYKRALEKAPAAFYLDRPLTGRKTIAEMFDASFLWSRTEEGYEFWGIKLDEMKKHPDYERLKYG